MLNEKARDEIAEAILRGLGFSAKERMIELVVERIKYRHDMGMEESPEDAVRFLEWRLRGVNRG